MKFRIVVPSTLVPRVFYIGSPSVKHRSNDTLVQLPTHLITTKWFLKVIQIYFITFLVYILVPSD